MEGTGPNPIYAREKAGIFSKLLFCWVTELLSKGRYADLSLEDIQLLPPQNGSGLLFEKLHRARNQTHGPKSSCRSALTKVFVVEFAAIGIGLFIKDILRISEIVWLGLLIRYFGGDFTQSEGYAFAGALVGSTIFYVIIHHPITFLTQEIGIRIRTGLVCLIYRKALHINQKYLDKSKAEEIAESLSKDLDRLDSAWTFLHYLWIGPLVVLITVLILWYCYGVYSLVGVGVTLAVLLPLQGILHKWTESIDTKLENRRKTRTRIMTEIISGFSLIKMNTWESVFAENIRQARDEEIKLVQKAMHVRALNYCLYYSATNISTLAMIVAYVCTGHHLTPEKVFVTLALFNHLNSVILSYGPNALRGLMAVRQSLKNIDKFLSLEERELDLDIFQETSNLYAGFRIVSTGLFVENLTIGWNNMPTLDSVSLQVKAGELVGVVGTVGCGKSTLLKAILQEVPEKSGNVRICGRLVYVSQDPWIFYGTIRQNILCGHPFDLDWYGKVLDACILKAELNLLEFQDQTLLDSSTVSKLSRSLKARINLARAVYADGDIVLLDDPLSSVDGHIGRLLLEKCIKGILKPKAILLATHQVRFLEDSDQVIILAANGSVEACGRYAELLQKQAFQFSHGDYYQVEHVLPLLVDQDHQRPPSSAESKSLHSQVPTESEGSISHEDFAPLSYGGTQLYGTFQPKLQGPKASRGKDLPLLSRKGKNYPGFLRIGNGCCRIAGLGLLCLIGQILFSGSNYWLALWSGVDADNTRLERPGMNMSIHIWSQIVAFGHVIPELDFVWVYTGLVLTQFMVSTAVLICIFSLCTRSYTALYGRLSKAIFRAPLKFIESHSVGIQKAFSNEFLLIDEALPKSLASTVVVGLQVFGAMLLVSMMSPILIIPSLLLVLVLLYVRALFLNISSSITKLEEDARKPVMAQLMTTLSGLTTIRAFDRQELFEVHLHEAQDTHSSAAYTCLAASRWLLIQMDWLVVLYLILTTFTFMLTASQRGSETNGPKAGLAIYSAMMLTGLLGRGIRKSVASHDQKNAVHRVFRYVKAKPENRIASPPDNKPPPSWPLRGDIRINNLSIRYGSEPYVLRDVACHIQPKEKIGIVDSTGGGITALIAALFRFVEASGGFIVIDDINTRQLGLHELRSKITLIPQTPLLFAGTLRKNLDPLCQYTDEQLVIALQQVKLLDRLHKVSSSFLDIQVAVGGLNYDVGERLLIFLARSILKQNRIVVLEETRVNIDQGTDVLVQKAIQEEFEDCTVLTVAHRLQTVMDSDRVLVIESGRIVEFDKPFTLLSDPNSRLSGLLQQAGTPESELLRQLAEIGIIDFLIDCLDSQRCE